MKTAAVLAGALLWRATAAHAAPMRISPTTLTLGPANTSGLIRFKNTGSAPVRFEVRTFAWSQTPTGAAILGPTREILCYPLVFEVPAGVERTLRVAASATAGPTEKAFRIVLHTRHPRQQLVDELH